jgi:hypothetical protein
VTGRVPGGLHRAAQPALPAVGGALSLIQAEGWHTMDVLTVERLLQVIELLKIVALMGGLVATVRLCRGWVTGGLTLRRKHRLARLRKQRARLQQLLPLSRLLQGQNPARCAYSPYPHV